MRFRVTDPSRLPTGWLLTVAVALLATSLGACDSNGSEGTPGPGRSEVITRVVLQLSDGLGNTSTAGASDPDGDGRDLVAQTMRIITGVTYNGSVQFFGPDDSDVTDEVLTEGEWHQVFFTFKDGFSDDDVQLALTDVDINGAPIGLTFRLTFLFPEAGQGVLNVTLRHYDDAPKDGTAAGGEIDVEVDFPVETVLQ